VPKIRDFLLIIIGWGESGKVILQVSIAFYQALLKNFSGKDGSASPLEIIGPYAYAGTNRTRNLKTGTITLMPSPKQGSNFAVIITSHIVAQL